MGSSVCWLSESARLGAEIPLPPMLEQEEGSSVRERYAPMHRLLAQDDDLFLVGQGFPNAAKKLRREHRHCYFRYLACLTQEIRDASKARRSRHGIQAPLELPHSCWRR
jgi:hypothetical protein